MRYDGWVKRVPGLLIWGMVFAILSVPTAFAQVIDESTSLPGVVVGRGSHFQVIGSEYADVVVKSTQELEIAIQSMPDVVTIVVKPVSSMASTELTISGLRSQHRYFMYEDELTLPTEVITNDQGEFTYTQDLFRPHLVFIQEEKSTLFITDTADGGDCSLIGMWDGGTKTCTLTSDVDQTIQISSAGVTLDGAGHMLTSGEGATTIGVMVPRPQTTVKNMVIKDFARGISLNEADGSVIEGNTIENAARGIYGVFTDNTKIEGNEIVGVTAVTGIGMEFFWSNGNQVVGNTLRNVFSGIQLFAFNTNNNVNNNVIEAGQLGFYINVSSDNNSLYGNDIIAPAVPLPAYIRQSSGNVFNAPEPGGGNYWSSFDTLEEGCENSNGDDFCDGPFVLDGGVDNLPRILPVAQPPAAPPMVVFLPGFQGSRLYKPGQVFENRLWEPNRKADVQSLFLDEQGRSLDASIYTRDVIDEAFGFNIYKSFSSFMDQLVTEGVLTAWQALPYDWRLSNASHVPAMIDYLEQMAAEHEDSQLTIVAHSNGGLIAQLVLQELERRQAAGQSQLFDRIDQLVMVASPQLGTPRALAGVLHGYGQEIAKGFILDTLTARELAEHMHSALTLLPAASYFGAVTDPVLQFDASADIFSPWTSTYGDGLNTSAELQQFLLGENGTRVEPSADDIISPNVLSPALINSASTSQAELANWTPPNHLQVVQIAGWGLDTIKALKYQAEPDSSCGQRSEPFCKNGQRLAIRPVFTADGDGTVVIPSAVAQAGDTYYLNLFVRNQSQLINILSDRDHANILEVQEVRELLKNVLVKENEDLPQYIQLEKPEPDNTSKKLRVSVHSPVSINIYDEHGRHTGTIPNPDPTSDLTRVEEQIPNSYYFELGESKYIGVGSNDSHTIALQGTGFGTFTLEIEEVHGDTVVDTVTFPNIPVTPSTTAEMSISSIEEAGNLELNLDGQGEPEILLDANEELTALQLIEILEQTIRSLDLHRVPKKSIELHFKAARTLIERGLVKPAANQLNSIQRVISKEHRMGITEAQTQGIVEIIERIKMVL